MKRVSNIKRYLRWKLFAVVVFIVILIFSGWQLWGYFVDARDAVARFTELAEQIEKSPTPSEEVPPEWTVFDQFGALFEQNSDMIGWITVNDMPIRYPRGLRAI